jgi:hypothetical protein
MVKMRILLLGVTATTLAKAARTLVLGAPPLRRYTLPGLGLLALISLRWAIWM